MKKFAVVAWTKSGFADTQFINDHSIDVAVASVRDTLVELSAGEVPLDSEWDCKMAIEDISNVKVYLIDGECAIDLATVHILARERIKKWRIVLTIEGIRGRTITIHTTREKALDYLKSWVLKYWRADTQDPQPHYGMSREEILAKYFRNIKSERYNIHRAVMED